MLSLALEDGFLTTEPPGKSSDFVFSNPNIKGTCGYEESFNIWNLRTAPAVSSWIAHGNFEVN